MQISHVIRGGNANFNCRKCLLPKTPLYQPSDSIDHKDQYPRLRKHVQNMVDGLPINPPILLPDGEFSTSSSDFSNKLTGAEVLLP